VSQGLNDPRVPKTESDQVLFSFSFFVFLYSFCLSLLIWELYSQFRNFGCFIFPNFREKRAIVVISYFANQIVEAVRKNAGEVWYVMAKDEGHGWTKKGKFLQIYTF
jgi:hypothetical protein